jgi:pilus assembly protein CpaE
MRVCVISDQDTLGTRIRRALIAAGQECPESHIVRPSEAESYLLRARPEMVVAATGPEVEAAVTSISRLRDLIPGFLLAVGPVSEPKLVLRILRGGAADYVDEDEVETELGPALARLQGGRPERAAPGRFYAVLASGGGSGSSLVAVNLAVAMAKLHERSFLIDLKPRSGDLAAMLDLKPSHTMQDLCRIADRIDRVLFEQTLTKHASGVSLLASPRNFEATFSEDAIGRALDLGRALFPRMIADVDPTLPAEAIATLRQADTILLVMRLEFNALRNARSMLDHMERRGIDSKRVELVGNRVGQPKEIPALKVEEALARKFFAKLPEDPKSALASQNNGVPVLKEYPSSRLSKAINAMAAALNALAPNPVPASKKV